MFMVTDDESCDIIRPQSIGIKPAEEMKEEKKPSTFQKIFRKNTKKVAKGDKNKEDKNSN